MKKIINGKLYDIDTAYYIADNQHLHAGDLHHYVEDLYRKENGEFFLACKGNAGSKYCEQSGQNTWSSGKCIVPLTDEETKQWLADNDYIDEYEQFFGRAPE